MQEKADKGKEGLTYQEQHFKGRCCPVAPIKRQQNQLFCGDVILPFIDRNSLWLLRIMGHVSFKDDFNVCSHCNVQASAFSVHVCKGVSNPILFTYKHVYKSNFKLKAE